MMSLCYYSPVHRLILLLGAVVLLTAACAGRTVRVSPPSLPGPSGTGSSSASNSVSGLEEGLASYYAEPYHGRRTASGEVFDTYQHMTAAHRTLPFNTVVLVRNKLNGREVEVRINDRGPFIDGRVIDLSLLAARTIDMVSAGVVPVLVRIIKPGDNARYRPPGGAYAVQVAAFENSRAAESLRDDLAKRYQNVSVQPVESDRTFYRVRVGRETNLEAAEELANRLRDDDFDPFIVLLD